MNSTRRVSFFQWFLFGQTPNRTHSIFEQSCGMADRHNVSTKWWANYIPLTPHPHPMYLICQMILFPYPLPSSLHHHLVSPRPLTFCSTFSKPLSTSNKPNEDNTNTGEAAREEELGGKAPSSRSESSLELAEVEGDRKYITDPHDNVWHESPRDEHQQT